MVFNSLREGMWGESDAPYQAWRRNGAIGGHGGPPHGPLAQGGEPEKTETF